MSRPTFINQLIAWFRAGYPDGVPSTDYVPLLAVLRRQVSEGEARQIATALIEEGEVGADGVRMPISKVDAGVLITKVLNELPEEADVARVRARVERAGWPFDSHPLGAAPKPDEESN